MYYLAAPYSNVEDKDELMEDLCKVDAYLMSEHRMHTVSPLMKHFILRYANLPGDWEYWQHYSRDLLDRCEKMIVLLFDGWSTSTGVLAEMRYCADNNIPIMYFDPYTMEFS